jgi:hypothetical protein
MNQILSERVGYKEMWAIVGTFAFTSEFIFLNKQVADI